MAATGKGTDRPAIKRFYTAVSVAEALDTDVGGVRPCWAVLLDGRGIKTPAKRPLVVASRTLADALAAEWEAQRDTVDPATMPLTRLVNSAVDGVAERMSEVRAGIAEYAGSDLLCYHAAEPPELAERQSKRWGAIIAWARSELGLDLVLAAGVMPVAQSPATVERVEQALGTSSPIALAAMYQITTLTGSVFLALAVARGRITPDEAWALAHIDEDYQIEKWGQDEEAAERREARWLELRAAALALAAVTRP